MATQVTDQMIAAALKAQGGYLDGLTSKDLGVAAWREASRRAIAAAIDAAPKNTMEDIMTENDLQQFLSDNRDHILAEVRRRSIEKLLEEHRWNISGQVGDCVNKFVAEEIIPEIKAHLNSQKSEIIAAAIVGAKEIGDAIAQGLTLRAAKNLQSDTYQFRQIMEALFK